MLARLENSRRHKKPDLEQVLYILREVNELPIFGSEPMYELNGKWVDFTAEELYDFSLEITSNPSKDHEERLAEITTVIRSHLIDS